MEYKADHNAQYLTNEDHNENRKTLYIDLEDPKVKANIDTIFDYIINDWMGSIFELPVSTPIFFDMKKKWKNV